uniref:Uncharacterized protein n=1 Tax=Arundo donax TaxID=35708 RepID=A0A0A8XRZ4_ARUDO
MMIPREGERGRVWCLSMTMPFCCCFCCWFVAPDTTICYHFRP